jgi:hypothetical protein
LTREIPVIRNDRRTCAARVCAAAAASASTGTLRVLELAAAAAAAAAAVRRAVVAMISFAARRAVPSLSCSSPAAAWSGAASGPY